MNDGLVSEHTAMVALTGRVPTQCHRYSAQGRHDGQCRQPDVPEPKPILR
jgi:hypothetical protein